MTSSNALQIMWPTTNTSPLPIKSPIAPKTIYPNKPTSLPHIAHLFANAIYFWRIDFNNPNAHFMFCLTGRNIWTSRWPLGLGHWTHVPSKHEYWRSKSNQGFYHNVQGKKHDIPEIKGGFEYRRMYVAIKQSRILRLLEEQHIQHGLSEVKTVHETLRDRLPRLTKRLRLRFWVWGKVIRYNIYILYVIYIYIEWLRLTNCVYIGWGVSRPVTVESEG